MGAGISTLLVDYLANLMAIETLIGQAREVKMSFEERIQA
jgi:hypothetical protein